MANPNLGWTSAYHQSTKHSVDSLRASRHVLDWQNQPLPFKIYPRLDPIPLPRDFTASTVPALDAIASSTLWTGAATSPDSRTLARLLFFAAGVTRKVAYANAHETYFRAAACTGALYHIDLYLVCGTLADLDAGVYHFGAHDFALRRLRAGDHRQAIVSATADEPAAAAAPAIVVLTSTFWRNAWKYQARTYRHCFWDSGTILANMLAVAAADRVPIRPVLGFIDRQLNDLLDLDVEREAALVVVAVGHDPNRQPGPAPPAPALALETVALSKSEIGYAAIQAAHAASSLESVAEVEAWRRAAITTAAVAAPPAGGVPLRSLDQLPAEPVDDVIRRRGSTRTFARTAISFEQLSTLLERATHTVAADFVADPAAHLCDLYLIVNAVDGLGTGTYVYRRQEHTLEPLRSGDFRRQAGFLALGQELAADASVNLYLLTDLRHVLERFGDRGYRAAQLEAAVVGGRFYLGAYALGLGATGLTFFDDAVTEFFSPHAAGKSVMFLTAVGRGQKRRLSVTG